jgi:hypothetical protein
MIGNKGHACDRCVDVKVPNKVGKKKRGGVGGGRNVVFQTLSLSTDGSRGLIKLADGSIRLGSLSTSKRVRRQSGRRRGNAWSDGGNVKGTVTA